VTHTPPGINPDERRRERFQRGVEGGVTGLTYSSALVALSAFVIGSFRPDDLPHPYVGHLVWLRTDTFGIICFFVATLGLATSEYLRRSRLANRRSAIASPSSGTIGLIGAIARALTAAGTTLVVYISVNAVTHPATLSLPATHLLSWPTEGILRALSLIVVAFAVAIGRVQRIAEVRKFDW
jgi:hypothetical protein